MSGNSSDADAFTGLLALLGFDGLLALVFWLCGWPMFFGSAVTVFVGLLLIGLVMAFSSDEPVVILSQLPDELREPLQPFVRRGRETLTVREITAFYRAAGELMHGRAELARHQTDLINATSGMELAIGLAEFLARLTPEERAMIEYRRRDY